MADRYTVVLGLGTVRQIGQIRLVGAVESIRGVRKVINQDIMRSGSYRCRFGAVRRGLRLDSAIRAKARMDGIDAIKDGLRLT